MTEVMKFPMMASVLFTMVSTRTAAVVLYSASEISNLNSILCAIISGMMTMFDSAPI